MSALLFTVLLGYLAYSLFLVYYWKTRQPLPAQPLNVEQNLPLPWLAQTSTVFSLTGLFGAYLGIALLLGLPALLGLAAGTVLGLFIVRWWIISTLKKLGKEEPVFEDFLAAVLPDDKMDGTIFAIALSGIQLVFATSELLILRELGKAALGLASEQATLLAIGIAILGYFYLLLGGYVALFHTDRIQLIVVCLTAVAVSLYFLIRHSQTGWAISSLVPRQDFWEIPFLGRPHGLYVWHFAIATVMGLGCLLCSPDTWKRVYQVNKDQGLAAYSFRRRILTFLAVGLLPYVVLLPVAISAAGKVEVKPCCPDPLLFRGFKLPDVAFNKALFAVFAIPLIASFLSSFNGSFLASVHVVLIWARKVARMSGKPSIHSLPEEARFYQIMMFTLLAISAFVFSILYLSSQYQFKNPWMIGSFLMGGYALVAGFLIGTAGTVSRLPRYMLSAGFLFGSILWVRYFLSSPAYCQCPTLLSIQTVPVGVGFCLALALLCAVIIFVNGRRHD